MRHAQWAVVAQGSVAGLGPQSLAALVWALGTQHSPGAPPPSQHLSRAVAQRLAAQLESRAGGGGGNKSVDGSVDGGVDGDAPVVPAPPEPSLSPPQLVAVLEVLARLGAGAHAPGLAALSCAALEVRPRRDLSLGLCASGSRLLVGSRCAAQCFFTLRVRLLWGGRSRSLFRLNHATLPRTQQC